MPAYTFTARSRAGETVTGSRQVASEGALALELAAAGLFLIQARPARTEAAAHGRLKLKAGDHAALLLHLASYLEAGLPLMAALEDFKEPHHPALEAAVADMARRLSGGALFSEVMVAYPGLFQPVHVGMVRAGEAMGRLDQALRAVMQLVAWNDALRIQVRKAATYPLILVGVLLIIVVLVSAFSLPAILRLLEELNIPLPLVTRVFLKAGHALAAYGWLLVALPLAGFFGVKAALRRPGFRLAWDTAVLRTPVAGSLVVRMALARFAHFFAAQYQAGIPLAQALRNSEAITGNVRMGRAVRALREGVEQGRKMAEMAALVGHFPPLVVRMLAIGEATGNLEEALLKAAAHFDREVEEEVRVFFALLDPALKMVMGCALVFVAMAIMLPLYMLIAGINNG